ncbi:epithelial sodium channel subunit alpha-like [Brevipalpus obovatus]|uniref:epithelial sodium channel subunit alpha-like n=1 Tax=Brevipalpus obovatus TaxID=246614 RepID=UPI003D9DE6C7
MPITFNSRRRNKRRIPLDNCGQNDFYSSNLYSATADLPWYCHGSKSGANDYNTTYVASKVGKQRIAPPIIIYRDVVDQRPNDLTALLADSSVPGLREICHSDHFFRKIAWLIVFFFLGFLALRDIHQLLSEFYRYPVTVDVRLRESRKLPFPAVTVCNLNIVRYSALCNSTLNISMPIELQEKLCGTVATALNPKSNGSIEDINDIGDDKKDADGKGTETTPLPLLFKDMIVTSTTTERMELGSPIPREKRQAWRRGQKGPSSGATNSGTKPNIQSSGIRTTTPPSEASFLQDEVDLTEREEKELQENLTTWLAVMWKKDKKITLRLGHQFEQMVLRCTIKSTNCTHSKSFAFSFTPTEGNCFTYKSQTWEGKRHKHVRQEETSLAGVDHGLELVLNLEVGEYLPGTAQVGALVMVHAPDEFGISASEAIFVGPEKTSYIGLKMTRITRLPSPYPEHCIDHWPEALTGSLTRNSTYSQQACLKICLQRTIQTKCQCQSAFLNQLELNDTNLRICDTRRKNTRKCVEEVMLRPESKIDDCLCPPRCQVTQYEKTVSLAKWPSREDRVSFDRGGKITNFQSLAKVVVYFQTMTMQEVAQQGAWTTAKLLSSLGGFMGMYVGFSFLSLFEVLEVLARRIWYSCTRRPIKFKTLAQTIMATLQYKMKRNIHGSGNSQEEQMKHY